FGVGAEGNEVGRGGNLLFGEVGQHGESGTTGRAAEAFRTLWQLGGAEVHLSALGDASERAGGLDDGAERAGVEVRGDVVDRGGAVVLDELAHELAGVHGAFLVDEDVEILV